MPLHLTKVAFATTGIEHLAERLQARAEAGPLFITTRFQPKRHAEVAGTGSLYWILKHHLVARSPILGFEEAEGGRCAIRLALPLVIVRPIPRRAHQGWRYLEAADAPPDLAGEADGADTLPPHLLDALSALALI